MISGDEVILGMRRNFEAQGSKREDERTVRTNWAEWEKRG